MRNKVIYGWCNIVRPDGHKRKGEGRGRARDAMQSGLVLVPELDRSVVQRVTRIDNTVSYAVIGHVHSLPVPFWQLSKHFDNQVQVRKRERLQTLHIGNQPQVRHIPTKHRRSTIGADLAQVSYLDWFGLVPSCVTAEDLFCTFYDCDIVVVLRPLGGGRCHIIGTALILLCSWETSSETSRANEIKTINAIPEEKN